MKHLANLISKLTPTQYLRIVVLLTASLTCANMFVSAMRYEAGFGYTSFLAGPDDRFADLVKVGLSFKTFTSKLESSNRFRSWPEFYKTYYLNNPYGGKKGLAPGQLTHFHLPPISIVGYITCAKVIARTRRIWVVIVLFFGLYLLTVQWTISTGIPKDQRTKTVKLAVWFFFLLSYPSLLVFTRGNFNAGFASLLIVAFMLSLFGRGRAKLAALASLAVAVNFRPNAVIFVLALPIVLGIKPSIKPILRFAALASGLFVVSYFVAHALYPDYTLRAFLQGLGTYNKLYVIKHGGDRFNSSLYGLLRAFNEVNAGSRSLHLIVPLAILTAAVCWGLRRASRRVIVVPLALMTLYWFVVSSGYSPHIVEAFLIFSAILVAAVCWGLRRISTRIIVAPFLLTALYCLLCPVFSDYHLLVFIGPALLVFLSFREWARHYHAMSAIALGSILALSAKNYVLVYFPGQVAGLFLPQAILNPLVFYFLTLYIVKETVYLPRFSLASLPSEGSNWPVEELLRKI